MFPAGRSGMTCTMKIGAIRIEDNHNGALEQIEPLWVRQREPRLVMASTGG